MAREELVRIENLDAGCPLPRVAAASLEGIDLIAWAQASCELLEQELTRYGALLFRGFPLSGPGDLERFVAAACGSSIEYTERSSPRSQVSGRIYTSTDYPPELPIFLHTEQSYNLTFPLRILFMCMVPAERGGATPIADVRRVYQRIDPAVRRRFVAEGYLYVRNFGGGLGLPWQSAFNTEEPAVVEAYCRANRIDFEWKPEGRLRTRQLRRAAGRHPRSGESVWFNHLTFFHVSTLEPAVRDSLLAELAPEDLPNNTYYADGSEISPEVMEHLRAAYSAETVTFPWQKGDLLMLDNMAVAHGREAFSGVRRVVVAMAAPYRWDDIEPVEE